MTLCILGGWGALAGARHLEADNTFCVSCHADGGPLHTRQFDQLARGRGDSLATAHHRTVRVAGTTRPMRCIDCHRGADRAGQLRLDLIALKDLAAHLTGRGREPDGVTLEVADAVCMSCHAAIEGGRFHAFTAHRGALTVRCVACHRSHTPGAGPAHTDPAHTPALCARCHPGLADKVLRVARGLDPDAEPSEPLRRDITN
ncbi:MAG: hypothetical protein HZA24_04660 [Nitrospirae bacterium]|nr:hypothetical protein [Nitrospirota bacterium]